MQSVDPTIKHSLYIRTRITLILTEIPAAGWKLAMPAQQVSKLWAEVELVKLLFGNKIKQWSPGYFYWSSYALAFSGKQIRPPPRHVCPVDKKKFSKVNMRAPGCTLLRNYCTCSHVSSLSLYISLCVMITSLPIELILLILSYLPATRDRTTLRCVSKTLRSICEIPSLLRKFEWPSYDLPAWRGLCC